jgi:hypothetical protein
MGAFFEMWEPPARWGSRQPQVERLERDGAERHFLVYRLPTGQETRVELGPTPRLDQHP